MEKWIITKEFAVNLHGVKEITDSPKTKLKEWNQEETQVILVLNDATYYVIFSGEKKKAKEILDYVYEFLASPQVSLLDIRYKQFLDSISG